ncbi:MAG: Cof-type HAD-IIB family hydrolase [Lachnospiraceae bacterium]|nr:Cof-type HAD-IIB family hydrolase [Lachnospiraceae bacterium]
MNFKLLVLDIDGTVTNSDKKVLKETRDAIIQLQENGTRVVIASGRPPRGVFSIAEKLEFGRFGSYILAFNGARIINFGTGACVYEKKLPAYIPVRLWKDALKKKLGMVTYTEDAIVTGTETDPYMMQESGICHMPLEYHEDFSEYVNFPVNGCLLTGEEQKLESLEPFFERKYFHETQIFHSEPGFLEVVPKNVDKAYSLKHLLNILGMKREEMVCCGDSFNDISMVRFAGMGVAMANAQAKLKNVADYVTERDNDHNGIVEVIERFF